MRSDEELAYQAARLVREIAIKAQSRQEADSMADLILNETAKEILHSFTIYVRLPNEK